MLVLTNPQVCTSDGMRMALGDNTEPQFHIFNYLYDYVNEKKKKKTSGQYQCVSNTPQLFFKKETSTLKLRALQITVTVIHISRSGRGVAFPLKINLLE